MGRLIARQLCRLHLLLAPPAREDSLSRRPQVAHPIHDPERRDEIALPILLDNHDRSGARLPALASAHGEQVHRSPKSAQLDARAQQSRREQISQTHKRRDVSCCCRCGCHGFLLDSTSRVAVETTFTSGHLKERGLRRPFWDRSSLRVPSHPVFQLLAGRLNASCVMNANTLGVMEYVAIAMTLRRY